MPAPVAPGRVVGTAGHIDHGKTALVRALTGIDTDRLKEEKERGITIELGFAHLDLTAEGVPEPVGVIDVPGHERFLRAMVAGAVGIDAVVLVVAADEGVMPQTREHLDVCRLLDVRRGVVALTKSDLVDAELLALAVDDVRGALRGTFLADAAIVPCSAVSGAGLGELRRALAEALVDAPAKDPEGLLRLPLDRVFTLKGFGTVVTGTLWAGRLQPGDDVIALPQGPAGVGASKVRAVHVHGAAVPEAHAGQRTAANLGLPREAVERGQVLVRAGELRAGRLLDVRLSHLATSRHPLKRRARVLLNAGTAQTMATVALLDRGEVEPGGEALAQLHLDEPMVALPGDRFVLRGFALQKEHRTTLGGGVVLRVLGPRHRRGTPELCDDLRRAAEASVEERVALEVRWAGLAGLAREELQIRVPSTPRRTDAAITRLLAARAVLRFDRERGALAHASVVEDLRRRVLAAVDGFHAAEPLRPGLPREALRSQLPSVVNPRLLHLALEELTATGDLSADRELARRPGHDVAAQQQRSGVAPAVENVAALLREAQLQPPRPADAALTLRLPLAAVTEAIDLLCRGGQLVRVADLVFDRGALEVLRGRLTAYLREHREITPQQWKDLVGASRKFTIPLAEYFDAERVTLRVGEVRRLRG